MSAVLYAERTSGGGRACFSAVLRGLITALFGVPYGGHVPLHPSPDLERGGMCPADAFLRLRVGTVPAAVLFPSLTSPKKAHRPLPWAVCRNRVSQVSRAPQVSRSGISRAEGIAKMRAAVLVDDVVVAWLTRLPRFALAAGKHAVEVIALDGVFEPIVVAARNLCNFVKGALALFFGPLNGGCVFVQTALLALGGDFAKRVLADVFFTDGGSRLSDARKGTGDQGAKEEMLFHAGVNNALSIDEGTCKSS